MLTFPGFNLVATDQSLRTIDNDTQQPSKTIDTITNPRRLRQIEIGFVPETWMEDPHGTHALHALHAVVTSKN